MEPIFAELNCWKSKHKEPAEPPVLSLVETDGQTIVFDTREHARNRFIWLDPIEARVLKEFRRPIAPESVIERVHAAQSEAGRAVERMIELGFVIHIADKGVSVVCESNWRVHPSNTPYPGGTVAPNHRA
jgi:hypothetical protein